MMENSVPDICEYLGGRAGKNFLGTGNIGLMVLPEHTRLCFAQRWWEGGLMDWAAGGITAWAPDRVEMVDPTPCAGARISLPPSSRQVFAARDDVIGMALEWTNATDQILEIRASFSGVFPGDGRQGHPEETGILYSVTPYSEKVPLPLYFALASSPEPDRIDLHGNHYEVTFDIRIEPGKCAQLTLFLGLGPSLPKVDQSLSRWKSTDSLMKALRQDWNDWFYEEIPRFRSSNPYFEKLYYYRWWSLYTKMIFAQVGHLLHPAPREGVIAFEGLVSYSSACVSIDELRWMRHPDWAFSTTQEFLAPENLNGDSLANHIWDWGIDGDESNRDKRGRSVPYHNYAVAAFHGALLVHPHEGVKVLQEIWPQLCRVVESYPNLFDADQDGLYETYPWSNAAGQEWSARYLYFNPIAEIFRYERGRTYIPDGTHAAEDLELVKRIRGAVVTDPDLAWPETADELYRLYEDTRDHRLATVDQNCYAYTDFMAAAALAALLKDTAAEDRYGSQAARARGQIGSVLWDPQDEFFYDVRPADHKHARVKSVTGFYPFWAGIATQSHLGALRHLFNPACFWTSYPLPSLPLDYEKYAEIQEAGWTYWNYATWPRTTCHAADGLFWAAKTLDPALARNAAELFDRYTCMHFPGGDADRPTLAERVDPHTAEPMLADLDYNHSSWIDLLIRHVAGLTPQETEEILIDPVDMGWDSFSLTRLRYRNHDIDIEYDRQEGLLVRMDGVVRANTPGLQKVILNP